MLVVKNSLTSVLVQVLRLWLAKRGYKVIGSDLSEAAINRARNVYANEKNVDFIVDNILNSKFKDSEFDYIFDRGCFHVSIKETVYQGTLDPFPKALFVVMINDKLRKRIHNNMLK